MAAFGTVVRVIMCCLVFSYFVIVPLKSRFRYDKWKTGLLVVLIIGVTVGITVLFLTGNYLSEYSTWGILLWLVLAVLIFHVMIKGSYLELLFLVLVVLNLYVNMMAIVKVISSDLDINYHSDIRSIGITAMVMVGYIPLLWVLLIKLYKKVVESQKGFSFWNYIWVIPALTYMVFFEKIINDYWKSPVHAGRGDVVFIVLWAFTTYMLFVVTLEMLIHAYNGVAAAEQMKLVTSQLRMQEEQYKSLVARIERNARIRHDWRHHLLSISGFAERDDIEGLQDYLKDLVPEYILEAEASVCSNHVVDIILQHYRGIAREKGIRTDIRANLPELTAVADMDLCIIFGNLVENAVEACDGVSEGNRYIEVRAELKGRQLIAMVKNSFDGPLVKAGKFYESRKHEGPGIGLPSVKSVVEKYDGIMKIDTAEDEFCVNLLIYAFQPCENQ